MKNVNLTGYNTANLTPSDIFQADLGWAVLLGAHTVAELAASLGASKGKVTYHAKKMAARGQLTISKEQNEAGRWVLVVRHAGRVELPRPAAVLPQEKTVDAKFERLVRTAKNNPGRLSRASERVARLGKRTASVALLDLASALNEQRHLVLQTRLGNTDEAAYHCKQRDAYLGTARRWIARHPNDRHLAA